MYMKFWKEYIDILKSALKAVIGPNAKLAYSVCGGEK